MRPQIVETRFCRFEVPWNWTISPGLGGFHTDSKRSAVVVENWLEDLTSASTYAEAQREILAANNPEIEAIEHKEFPSQDLGDCHWSAFLLSLPDGAKARQEQLVFVNGHLACSLTLTAIIGDDDAWSEVFPAVYRSLHFTARDWASKMSREPLTAASFPATSKAVEIRAPLLQICFPVRPPWSFEPSTGQLRSTTGAVISMRRPNTPANDPEILFAESLGVNQRSTSLTPWKWDKGETQNGYAFWVLESRAQFKKTWGPGESLVVRQAFLQDASTLEIRMESREGDNDAFAAFGDIISSYTLLPPSERQLRVQEPWLSLTLTGPWQEAGQGLFLRESEPPAFLIAQELPENKDLSSHSRASSEAFRSRPDVQTVTREEKVEGVWKGHEAHRYSMDFIDQNALALSLRASWFAARKGIYEVVVIGSTGSETEDLFLQSLEGFTPEARA